MKYARDFFSAQIRFVNEGFYSKHLNPVPTYSCYIVFSMFDFKILLHGIQA